MNTVTPQLSRSADATPRRTIARYASHDEAERVSLFFNRPEFFGVLANTVLGTAVFGGIFGAIAHALQRGRRDFASIGGVYADRVELQVDTEVADQARRLLDLTPSTTADPHGAPALR
jgi:hypothetical protein